MTWIDVTWIDVTWIDVMGIDVTDVIEFLEAEPLVTAIQRVAVVLTTACAACRQRRRSSLRSKSS
jgi:hypothetical protein